MNRFTMAVLACVGAATAANAAPLYLKITADNHYALYSSTSNVFSYHGGNEIGAGGSPGTYNWSLPETYNINVGDRVFIAAWSDDSVAQGLLAEGPMKARHELTERDRQLRVDPLGQRLGEEAQVLLESGLAQLNAREREVLAGRFFWPTPQGWLLIVYVGLMPSFVSQLSFMRGVELIGPARASVGALRCLDVERGHSGTTPSVRCLGGGVEGALGRGHSRECPARAAFRAPVCAESLAVPLRPRVREAGLAGAAGASADDGEGARRDPHRHRLAHRPRRPGGAHL